MAKWDIKNLLETLQEKAASDLHLTVGVPPVYRVDGMLHRMEGPRLLPQDTQAIAKELLMPEQFAKLTKDGEIDFAYSLPGTARFRINAYIQRGSVSMAFRLIPYGIPQIDELSLPPVIRELSLRNKGLVIVTGPTGSGKSTTLAAMVSSINQQFSKHIITLEDPIEFLHKHNQCIVNQREIGSDTQSFATGLRAALREDPDVILVGEMRDLETIQIAIRAAETGHLVLTTLHTPDAPQTVDRILDVFPPHQQQQIRVQLSSCLNGVVAQQLVPKQDSGRIVATEVLIATPAVRNLVREGKTHQLYSIIQTGAKYGMHTMQNSIQELYDKNIISTEEYYNRLGKSQTRGRV